MGNFSKSKISMSKNFFHNLINYKNICEYKQLKDIYLHANTV